MSKVLGGVLHGSPEVGQLKRFQIFIKQQHLKNTITKSGFLNKG
jgi:hypothetical protein